MCESGGDPNASNGESIGLFQIHYPSHRDKVESRQVLFDPATNIRVAYEIWSEHGWSPWRWSHGCHGL